MSGDDRIVQAAGGVVLRETDAAEVLMVHRVKYDDWSLPKGKLEPGEPAEVAAGREVEEETGVRAALLEELPSVSYPVEAGRKHVRWWRMTPLAGDPDERPPDREVDVARWVPVEQALATLSYAAERDVLRHAINPAEPRAERGGGR